MFKLKYDGVQSGDLDKLTNATSLLSITNRSSKIYIIKLFAHIHIYMLAIACQSAEIRRNPWVPWRERLKNIRNF